MKLAVLTCGMLPIPAVKGGAVENLIDFYLDYNDREKIHDITVYSPWDAKAKMHSAFSSDVNHYIFIDVTSLKARIGRRIYKRFHSHEYNNYFIEYYFEKAYAIIKKKTYDHIILENCPGYTYKLSHRGYRNLILHLHNDLLNSQSRCHDAIYDGLTKVLTVSDYIKERVSTIRPDSKIHTVFNGIDLEKFSPKESLSVCRKTIGFSEDDFVIAYSGRINKDKGISELVDAMLQLRNHLQFKLLVLGSSFFDNVKNEDAFIRSLKDKAKSIKERIVFTGYIPYSQVPDYLQLADIAALPSMWEEPFGLTIIEAMAVGLPLITTRSGGIPEICKGVATIVERENIVNNLANGILDLYKNEGKRKQMSAASIERARLFDKETFAKNLFATIEKT